MKLPGGRPVNVENILSDLIRIQSVNPPGGELAVAQYLKRLFDERGIPNEIIEPQPGRATFIATLGQGKKSLLYASHEDVVPVAEGWSFPPFSGEIKDGYVYGRGALDCKGLVAAETCAVLKLAEKGMPGGRLIFAAFADEEVGSRLGSEYIVAKHPEKLRADFAINEGAEPPVTINGKVCHFIGAGEKGPSWLRLRTRGIAGHGSVPFLQNNAIVRMNRILDGLVNYKPRIVLTPEVRVQVEEVARLTGYRHKIDEHNLDDFLRTLGDISMAAYLGAITRMTVSPDVIHGGVKTNIVPDKCEAEIDIRILPGQNKDYVLSELKSIIGDAEVEIIQYSPPTLSPADSDAYRLILATMKESLGDVTILPAVSPGATDSRFLREIGIPSYGIGMMTYDIDPAMKSSVHGKNEKVDIKSLREKAEFLVRLATKYLGSARG
jgi:acetylornithine deacetylase/succinyl-diaminopimelate desuccinylase-like protein